MYETRNETTARTVKTIRTGSCRGRDLGSRYGEYAEGRSAGSTLARSGLDAQEAARRGLPRSRSGSHAPGVYRLRASGCPGLIYIGISDRLSSRLSGLRRARYRPDMKGHSAAACVAAYEAADKIVSVSWATISSTDRRALLGLEVDLIAAHRQNFGSPACQFHGEGLAW